jgi:hypothetical protein
LHLIFNTSFIKHVLRGGLELTAELSPPASHCLTLVSASILLKRRSDSLVELLLFHSSGCPVYNLHVRLMLGLIIVLSDFLTGVHRRYLYRVFRLMAALIIIRYVIGLLSRFSILCLRDFLMAVSSKVPNLASVAHAPYFLNRPD